MLKYLTSTAIAAGTLIALASGAGAAEKQYTFRSCPRTPTIRSSIRL